MRGAAVVETGNKTNYSPLRQMSQRNFQDDHNFGNSSTSNNNNNNIDNDRLEPDENLRQVVEEEGRRSPEEVYVYNCCGITSELRPSIKFMSSYKCVFFLFNFLVFIFGLANFGMGLWFRIDPKVYEIHKYIETQNFTIAGWLLLFCGFAACIMALIGFLAASQQAIGLLMFYLCTMIALTLAFVGTLVLLTVYGLGFPLEQFLIKEIYEQIRRRAMNSDTDPYTNQDAAQFVDFIQLRCCGAFDFRDYLKLGMTVPTTCYTIDKNYISAPGCGHALRLLLDLRAGLATGFTFGSIVAQLFTIISSGLMFCSIYHYRAIPKPVSRTPTPRPVRNIRQTASFSRDDLDLHPVYLQRPRSRTPIVI